MLSRTWES